MQRGGDRQSAKTFARPMDSFVAVLTAMLCVVTYAHAQLYEGETCSLYTGAEGVCSTFADCPGLRKEIARGAWPKICSFRNRVPLICCSKSASTTTPTTTTTSTTTPTTTSTTTKKTTTATYSSMPLSYVDEDTMAGQKCQEYARYVYWEVEEETLMPIPEFYNRSECAMKGEELIVDGVEAIAKEFPHMAALGYGSEDDIQWLCAGSLISERFVLTAAHCYSAQGLGDVRWVRLGDLDLYSSSDPTQPVTLHVSERIKHEEYKPPAYYNDIALLKLERDVTFSPYIRPACLYTRPGNPPRTPNATASGWGKRHHNHDVGSETLMKVDIELQDESRCNRKFRNLIRPDGLLRLGITSESMICAGDPVGVKDTCEGDSGGPLQIKLRNPDPYCMYSIIGLTSFGGYICGRVGQPAVYTRVSNFIPWIERHVWP